ncbi:hypothetical protein C8A00DRAFT_35033 [Chaetomidium leptoderma]|uniref:protein-tyrosine-phosphatase n=1 Tax=Chaetomidium leptoderma TaxID=669021 RepID=A0AAN6VJ71_9PEZI|nr:hypothetical protein C8A00DRAFT_35033 [Chaetomidium leptoderma]
MPPEHRTNDRPSYYTMKTPAPVSTMSPQGLTHPCSSSQSYINGKPATSPMASQPHPPKLSPGAARGAAHDARAPSPNYFGLAVDPIADPRDPCSVPRENWSSPSSSVKSFAAAIPKQLPLDANPEFEAFRRQVDANRARTTFSLSGSRFSVTTGSAHTPSPATVSALQRPRPPRWHTQGAEGSDFPFPRPLHRATGSFTLGDASSRKADRDNDSLQGFSAYGSADSKRSSAVSMNPPCALNMRRHEIPPPLKLQSTSPTVVPAPGREGASPVPSPQSTAGIKTNALSPSSASPARTAVSPQTPYASGPTMISPTELKSLLEIDQDANLLVLDLRVSPQFAHSRVRGALNLCIPTTLLKRATFNLQKLQQTFQADQDQERFSSWRDASHLVVYDASSSDKRDAISAINMIKKFTNEGYSGSASILRGGFNAFAPAYPALIDSSSSGPSQGLSLGPGSGSGGRRANLPPILGGVLLPNANDNPRPFFSNIRQNQDLVDGVGQMDIGVPPGLAQESLPRWLRAAAATSDHGKRVSDKFLSIERAEQSRMREAYSVVMPTDCRKAAPKEATKVQLAGIEKGGKNRYKDILPFEHARVRLLGRPEGACDYVNASHLRASRSHKRYIASQGPLPATFEDFWSVVWDNDVRVVVMLTAESEGGQLKCHPYWKGSDFGPIQLRVLSEKKVSLDIDGRRSSPNTGTATSSTLTSSPDSFPSDGARRRANTTSTTLDSGANPFNFAPPQATGAAETPHVIIRKFALSHAAHPFLPIREITQLHYPSWPDFGAPAKPSHLLALVELANITQRAALATGGVPGTLGSALSSASRQNSGIAADGASNPFFFAQQHGSSDRGSSAATFTRADTSENISVNWDEGPESHDHARPMLVHCSAGCGRTGAFCTVDSVIDMLKRQRQHMLGGRHSQKSGTAGQAPQPPETLNRDADGDISMGDSEGIAGGPGRLTAAEQHHADAIDIDTSWLDDDSMDLIAQTVEDFRGQRLSMVQSLRQFVLCYETVLEWIRRLQECGVGGLDSKGRGRSGSLAF